MKFWEVTANGGDRWSAEGLLFPHPNEEIQNNFVTSYQWVGAKWWTSSFMNDPNSALATFLRILANTSDICRKCMKSQLVDLAKEGYNPSFMDDFQPDIKVSDWWAHLWASLVSCSVCTRWPEGIDLQVRTTLGLRQRVRDPRPAAERKTQSHPDLLPGNRLLWAVERSEVASGKSRVCDAGGWKSTPD